MSLAVYFKTVTFSEEQSSNIENQIQFGCYSYNTVIENNHFCLNQTPRMSVSVCQYSLKQSNVSPFTWRVIINTRTRVIKNWTVTNSAEDQGFTEKLPQNDVKGGGEEAIGTFKVATYSHSFEHSTKINLQRLEACLSWLVHRSILLLCQSCDTTLKTLLFLLNFSVSHTFDCPHW